MTNLVETMSLIFFFFFYFVYYGIEDIETLLWFIKFNIKFFTGICEIESVLQSFVLSHIF